MGRMTNKITLLEFSNLRLQGGFPAERSEAVDWHYSMTRMELQISGEWGGEKAGKTGKANKNPRTFRHRDRKAIKRFLSAC